MMSEDQLGQEIHGAAARGDSHEFSLKLLDRFYFRLRHEIELGLCVDDQDEPHRRAANSRGDNCSGGRRVVNRATNEGLHPNRSSY
jgi:hypothetical protein